MANPFEVRPVNALQALMMGQQGYEMGRGYAQDNAIAQAGKLYAAGDLQGAQGAAAQAGPRGLALLMNIANQQNNTRDYNFRVAESQRAQGNADRGYGFQQQEATRAQGNADRSFGLQQQAANNPIIQKDENGNIIVINKPGTSGTVLPVAGAPPSNNPFAYGGKMNEAESKDSGYANRMFDAEKILRDPAVVSAATSYGQNAIAGAPLVPGMLKNTMQSGDYQKFDQAARNFVNAVLRRESGAAISQSEFDSAYKQYFPQPGDTPERIKQKQDNRQATIASIAGGGGKNYKPQFSFGPNGEMVATGNAGQGVRPTQQAAPQNGPARISSQQEHAALAPGTQYVAPDGSIRTKQ